MTKSVHTYAVQHKYCPSTSSASNLPQDTVPGDCGDSFIYIYPLGNLEANVEYGFDSTEGTVVHRQLAVSWYSDSGLDGSWSDNSWMFSSSYDTTRQVNPGFGEMHTVLAGTVYLWWGGSCGLLTPTDDQFVGY